LLIEKRLVVVFLLMVQCYLLFSQEEKVVIDSIPKSKTSMIPDSIIAKRGLSKDAIDMAITHVAKGYRRTDLINKKVWLVGDAVVTYGDITLKADSIVLNMETGQVYAIGRRDSTGKVIGSPEFKQGEEQFKSKELTYNFKTKKGLIKNIFTEQDQGFLHSEVSKRLNDGTINISRSTYSTCNLEHPHFSVNFNKAKVIPGKKIISGPAYLVLEDIPLPLALPFGYFPVQKSRSSGLIIPKYGETQSFGYSLSDGGYYFVFSDYIDMALTGTLYTNGTWMLNASSNYKKLYRYTGNFSLSYASNITGHKGLDDYNKSSNYRIGWTYNQDEKSMPGSRFSASVNMSSSGYDKNNSYNVSDHINSQRQSSISYSKNWTGSPFNLSVSLNHSQNVKNKTIFLDLPKLNFNISRLYPLKGKNNTGVTKWYQELTISYTAALDNQINTTDSLLFTNKVWKNMRNGFSHQLPVSFQLRPFRNFSISPQIMYSGVLYTQKIEKHWDPKYYDANQNIYVAQVVNDTTRGFFYGQSVNPSISASYNPQLFGTYQFTNPGSRIQAIRHIIRPSVSFSYVPVLKGMTTPMYKQVQIDTLGRMREYSIFESNIYGTPSLSSRSGAVAFGLVNILEGKVFTKNDTTGKPKKVKLIDNFSLNTSYNIFADSMRWAPLSMNFRTTLFQNLNLAASGNFSFYGLDSKGQEINKSYYSLTKRPFRMTNLTASLDFDLGQLIKGYGKKKSPDQVQQSNNPYDDSNKEKPLNPVSQVENTNLPLDKYGYVRFDVPWTLRMAYSFYLTKNLSKSIISQTISLSGDLSLTKKTKITYTTGYDVTRKEITMTSVGIMRDLHCWDMSINWIPTGYMKSWNFTIKVKASVLADLKYDRRKDFRDQY
jgi:lipopolysaccharide assembly outer membrane protein LptD (OstA)